MEKHIVLGVHITDRLKRVPEVQKLLSDHGCQIKTRLGLHDTAPGACSPNGLLLLEMVGDEAGIDRLQNGLSAIDGVEVQRMTFGH